MFFLKSFFLLMQAHIALFSHITLPLVSNRQYGTLKMCIRDRQTADFISCVAFGRQGEFAEKYLHQGTKIAITGRIQTGSYTNKDGQRVYTTDVVVEEQEFAESKSSAAANSGAAYTPSRPEPSAAAGDGFMNIPDGVEDEGLPFN